MRVQLPPKSPWVRGGITWLVYCSVGLLSIEVLAPYDHLARLYLAAGMGLAFVVAWGPAMVWAVGLGAASVMWAANWTMLGSGGPFAMAAAGLATFFGAAAQAWVGARWGPSTREGSPSLEQACDILRFLIVAGPIACLINAGVSVGTLAALGLVPLDRVAHAAASWWVGDTLGVLLGTPMVLTLIGQPPQVWQRRRALVGLPLLVAALLLAAVVQVMHHWDAEREQAMFGRDAAALSTSAQVRLKDYLDSIEALRSLYVGSDEVTRVEFERASAYWLRSLQGVGAMGWYERVPASSIAQFEAQQRAQGLADFRVQGEPLDARSGAPTDAVLMRYVEPKRGNAQALGTRLRAVPMAAQAYERSMQEDRTVASEGFAAAAPSGASIGPTDVVLYRVIYQGDPYTPLARAQASQGAVFLALRMDEVVQAIVRGHPNYLRACLIDASATPQRVLGGHAACLRAKELPVPSHRALVPIDFAGRAWQLVVWTSGPVPIIGSITAGWALPAVMMMLAAALATLLLVITGQKRRIEAAMALADEQRAAAEASNRAKSEFLSRMSHELRTPLNAVLGFAQVMELDEQAALPPAQHQRLQQIEQAGWHLLDMIDDVLDLSRIDAGTLKLSTDVQAPGEAVQAAIEEVQALAEQRQIEIFAPPDAPAGWGVRADPTRLRQILVNLLSNAIKYNRDGGLVQMTIALDDTGEQAPCLSIAVHDTGLGMNASQMAQLFQPFNRLGRQRMASDGVGIGLSISRHLAQLMGGQLQAHSVEGQGSAFTLTLPAARLAGVRPAPQVPPLVPLTPQGRQALRHVLYVEDNQANSDVIRSALASRTWVRLSVAPTIEAGLAVLHDRLQGPPPDLVLLDVHLPDASGLEFLHLMKANPQTADIPVIMISADAMPEQVDAALAAGACCYLTKPVQIPALLAQVDELLAAPPLAAREAG